VNDAAIVFLVASVVSLLAGPTLIRMLARLKVRQTISEDAPERHRAKQGTPTMGGFIIFLGAAVGLAFARVGHSRVSAVILLTLAMMALGLLDDLLIALKGKSLGLKARHKLIGQFIIAGLFMWWVYSNRTTGTTVLHFGRPEFWDLGWAYYPLAVLAIVWMSNAFNLADGLDGLVGGLTLILSLSLGALVVMAAEGGLTVFSWATAGGCVGFLWYNSNPAKVFMGDTGSLALGAATAGIAVAGKVELLYLVLALVFVVEGLSVMIQVTSFKLTGKRIFKMTPIHHHFELVGWPEQKIVVRFWLIGGLLAVTVLNYAGVLNLWR
jgi:phospho-N-acetylmuramoyl-pentapeptide-transferase